MSDPNLLIWTSDWHVVSNDTDTGILGETFPKEAFAAVEHIRGLNPYGVIDTGDCKDHYGADQGDEHDNYVQTVRSRLPWLPVNAGAGINALYPILPGNHDEISDYPSGVTDFSSFDARFWSAPYHWTADWPAPQIRFIAAHSYIIHAPDANSGFFQMDSSENTWVTAQLAALPVGWKAIVCTHPATDPTFGSEIRTGYGGDTLRATLAANAAKIACHISGHRHLNMNTDVLSGITHFSGAGVSYTLSNARGGFMPIEYLPGTNQLKFHYRLGPPTFYGAFDPATYTPVVISL